MWKLELSVLGLLSLLPIETLAQQPPAHHGQPFLLLSSGETKDLKVRLTEAAASGYRVLTLFDGLINGTSNHILLERPHQPEPAEYLLLGVSRVPTLSRELNQAAAQGFRLLPHTVLVTKELVGIMEKRPGAEQRWEYLVIETSRTKTFEKETQQAIDEGWLLSWFYQSSRKSHVAIFERLTRKSAPTSSSRPGGEPSEISDAHLRVRLLSFNASDARFTQELNAMGGEGYRLIIPRLSEGDVLRGAALLEKTADAAQRSEYRVITIDLGQGSMPELTRGHLQQELSSAASQGFRLRWPALYSDWVPLANVYKMLLLAEKAPGAASQCEYKVLLWDGFGKELSPALTGGFRVVDAFSYGGFLAILCLEKCDH